MKIRQFIAQLADNERGNVLIIVAATTPLLLGAAGLGIDAAQLVLAKRELQRRADSAALAGAHAVAQQQTVNPAVTKSLELGRQMVFSAIPVVNNGPTSGPFSGNKEAVEVILSTIPPISFMPIFTGQKFTLTARAVAARVGSSPVCILSLDPASKYGIEMTGNAGLTLGCSMAANSNHSEAIRLTGNLDLNEVATINAVGGIEVSGNASVPNAQKFPYSDPLTDPYKDLAVPTNPSSCTYTNLKLDSGVHTLAPGRYCGFLEISGSAKVTFSPGNHIIAGEFFKINGGPTSSVNGNGVTFFLTDRSGKWAELDWNGDSTINLSAPKVSSGSPYAGVLIMQNRNAPSSTKNKINGNLNLDLRGSLYFPNQWFEWNGNTVSKTDCLRIIARQMYLNGNIKIANTCTEDDGVMAATKIKRVRLVQ